MIMFIDMEPRDPRIVRRHIDGPYLSRPNGMMHWLTWRERLMTKLGIWTAADVERRLPTPTPNKDPEA